MITYLSKVRALRKHFQYFGHREEKILILDNINTNALSKIDAMDVGDNWKEVLIKDIQIKITKARVAKVGKCQC